MTEVIVNLNAYGFDFNHPDHSAPLCLVNENLQYPFIVLAATEREQRPICLKVVYRKDIDQFDIVVPSWVLKILEISSGCSVGVKCVSIQHSQLNVLFRFEFYGYINGAHWDETGNSYDQSIQNIWPKGIRLPTFERYLPLFLEGKCLIDRGIIAINALGSLLFLIVHVTHLSRGDVEQGFGNKGYIFSAGDCSPTNITVPSDISCTSQHINHTNQAYLMTPAFRLTLARDIVHIIRTVAEGIVLQHSEMFHAEQYTWNGFRSFLLTAPKGSGKSKILECLKFRMAQEPTVTVICLKGNRREQLPTSTSSQQVIIPDTMSQVKDLISILGGDLAREYCSAIDAMTSSNFEGVQALMIIIDDMDDLLLQFSRDNDSADFSRSQRNGQHDYAAFCLRQVLRCANATTSEFAKRLILVGATRLSPAELPLSCSGAPEFDKIFPVRRPAREERVAILCGLLDTLGSSLEKLSPSENVADADIQHTALSQGCQSTPISDAEKSSHLQEWAQRLSGLSMGYLPGDLHEVVKRISVAHQNACRVSSLARSTKLTQSGADSTADARCDDKLQVMDEPRPHDKTRSDRAIQWKCALAALASVRPHQLQDWVAERNSPDQDFSLQPLTWVDFGGYSEAKAYLRRSLKIRELNVDLQSASAVVTVTTRMESEISIRMEEVQVQRKSLTWCTPVPRGFVLHGPPGCGKTYLATIIASEAGMNFVKIRSTDLLSKYFGETEATVRKLFSNARLAAPCALFFDDFDAIACKRPVDSDGGIDMQARVLSTFLNEMDGISAGGNGERHRSSEPENGVIVIVACSNIKLLDAALIRPGRLQHHISLGYPNKGDVEDILGVCLRRISAQVDLSAAQQQILIDKIMTVGATGACIEGICRRAVTCAIREHITMRSHQSTPSNQDGYDKDFFIHDRHFKRAVEELFM